MIFYVSYLSVSTNLPIRQPWGKNSLSLPGIENTGLIAVSTAYWFDLKNEHIFVKIEALSREIGQISVYFNIVFDMRCKKESPRFISIFILGHLSTCSKL